MRGADQVELDPQVADQKLDRVRGIGGDAADLRDGDDDHVRTHPADPGLGRGAVFEVERGAVGGDDLSVFGAGPPA